MDAAEEAVKKAFIANGFGLPPGTLDARMDEVLRSKGLVDESFPEIKMLGFCAPKHALSVIEAYPAAAVLLPCTVTIRQVGDRYHVGALDPRVQLGMGGDETPEAVRKVGEEAYAGIAAAVAVLQG